MASASNPQSLPSTTEKIHIDDVLSKDLTDASRSVEELPETEDKQKSPAVIKSPKISETDPEPYTKRKFNFIEHTLSCPVKTAFHCQELPEAYDKQGSPTDRKPSPIRTEILKDKSMESASNSEVLQSTTDKIHIDIISKDLTDANRSVQELPETEDKQKSPAVIKSPKISETDPEPYTNKKSNFIEHTMSVPVKTAFSENALESEASISKYSNKNDAVSVENAMISSVKHSHNKVFPEETGSVETVSIPFHSSDSRKVKKFPNSAANSKLDQMVLNTTRTSDVSPSSRAHSDMPPGSFPKIEEFSKSSYQEMKPPIIADMNCDKSLTELLSILDDWARKGLDKGLDRGTKISFVDIKANFKKDVQYGLSVMKQMSTRIHTLITAASKLPDPDTILAREFQFGGNRVRGDLITYGLEMWHSIHDIESQINHDLKILEIMCDNVSKLSTEYMKDIEEIVNPYNIVTNLYTSVISRFLMLRTEMENFHEKIDVFCSDLERLV